MRTDGQDDSVLSWISLKHPGHPDSNFYEQRLELLRESNGMFKFRSFLRRPFHKTKGQATPKKKCLTSRILTSSLKKRIFFEAGDFLGGHSGSTGGNMLSHKVQAKISKKGYLELKNLPFTAGTQVEITISKKKENKFFDQLIANDHVWAEEDIKAVEAGREIINQWKIS